MGRWICDGGADFYSTAPIITVTSGEELIRVERRALLFPGNKRSAAGWRGVKLLDERKELHNGST